MAQTKKCAKKWPFSGNFLCIFVKNFKRAATGLGRWENSENFLGTPEVYQQPWLTRHKDSQTFNFFRTPYEHPVGRIGVLSKEQQA